MACFYFPKRYIFAVLCHLGLFVNYGMRVNLSVAIVSMVNQTYANVEQTAVKECQADSNNSQTSSIENGELNWKPYDQGWILSSFFYGYLSTQLVGGWIANKYGGKWVFALGTLVSVVVSFISPVVSSNNYIPLLIVRVIAGIGQGVIVPALHHMIGQWSPSEERSRISVMSYCGVYTGSTITLPVAGILASSDIMGGWPSVFYLTGLMGLVWFLAWIYFISNRPDEHKTISAEEKKLIMSSLKDSASYDKKLVIPWFSIFTSIHVWAMIIAHMCKNWVWYMVLTGLPSYFKNVLNFNLKSNGLLSALPFIVGTVINFFSGFLADWLQNGRCSKQTAKRIITFFGFYPSVALLILTSYTTCDEIYLSVAYMVIATGFLSFNQSGYLINDLDIAPRFSGILMGIKNFAGTIPGCIAPFITGYLTNDDPSRKNYRSVFIIAACICAFGGTFFEIFVSGTEQPWNEIPSDVEKSEMKQVTPKNNEGYQAEPTTTHL